jgi:hypothetical protein
VPSELLRHGTGNDGQLRVQAVLDLDEDGRVELLATFRSGEAAPAHLICFDFEKAYVRWHLPIEQAMALTTSPGRESVRPLALQSLHALE